jgi:hypothetical protein
LKRSLQLNPDNKPATTSQIKAWRNTHEASPVTTTLGSFDCDMLSEKRMQDAIDEFDNLTTLNSNGTLNWVLGDNSVVSFTKAQLQSTIIEVVTERAMRSASLHVKAFMFKTQEVTPTPAQLADINFWLN